MSLRPDSALRVHAGWAVIAAAALLPLLFAAVTGHVWEDYFITLRSSRNLVEGHGLVFQPGERVHTFTSALGVLVPALFTWLCAGHDGAALWLYRLLGAGLLAASARLLWRRSGALGLGPVGRLVLFGLVLFDPKLADFATNGMETALLVFFAVLLWSELERAEGPRLLVLASAYAGLAWSRPDAFLLAGALTLPHLGRRSPGDAGARLWRRLGWAALLGALAFLPWLAWATWYYGSPVPHTITAKAAVTPLLSLSDWLLIPVRAVVRFSMVDYLYLPANFLFGGWPPVLRVSAHLLTVAAAFAWLWRGLPAAGRRASLTVFAGLFYLGAILLFAWYVPPWSVLASIALAVLADTLHRRASAGRPALAATVRIAAALAVTLQAAAFAAVAYQMRIQQRVIEREHRQAIGLWLRAEARPGDTVFLEPLGYIGYFSQLKMYDFPGLSSPEVTAAVTSGARRYADVVRRLRPNWLVLRPAEIMREGFPRTGAIEGYELVRFWDVQPKLDEIRFLPGRRWLEYDARFLVYRRTD